MNAARHWRIAAPLSASLIAAVFALQPEVAREPVALATDAPQPYVSPYPAPDVDANEPPQPQPPTF